MKTIQARKKAAKLVADSLDARIAKLKRTKEFKALKKQAVHFEENGSNNYHIDDSGNLVSSERIYLDNILCTDEEGNPDQELAGAILRECSEILYFRHEYNTEWGMEQCHGEPCIVTYPNERNRFSVYCQDLDLKVNRINSEEHGLMLVEQAIRKAGYFPDVVRVDQCGCATLTIPKEVVDASDEKLFEMIADAEADGE